MFGAAVALTIRHPRGFFAAWDIAPEAAAAYVRELARVLRKKQIENMPVGKPHIHPLSTRKQNAAATMRQSSVSFKERGTKGFATRYIVGTTAKHARFVTFGTRAHLIDRRRTKALTIWAPNDPKADEYGFVFRKRVKHKGIKNLSRWRELAAAETVPEAGRIWAKIVRKQLEQHGFDADSTHPLELGIAGVGSSGAGPSVGITEGR